MNDKKPNVIPTKEQIAAREAEKMRLATYEAEKLQVTNEIYTAQEERPQGHLSAMEEMKQRTANQLKEKLENGVVKDESLSEVNATRPYGTVADEQIKLRDAQLQKNIEQTRNYQRLSEEALHRHETSKNINPIMETTNTLPKTPTYVPPMTNIDYGQNPTTINPHIFEISQPNYNCAFDVIPLPSQGKLYKNKKANIRIGYMTTADENILTSPNLLASGEFLEILINRKILEPELRYADLHVGDRNAIMLWLRATGYGEMYPITMLDEEDQPFETNVNLDELKTKNLGAEPDNEGLFDFQFPLSKAVIKFKLLTCGDVDAIEKQVEKDNTDGVLINNLNTYNLEHTIVEVNGDRNKQSIKEFVSSIRIFDGRELTKYIEKIESGIDLNINVPTPRGGSIATFLPLNVNFFWPDFRL